MNTTVLDRSLSFIQPWLQRNYDMREIPGFVVAISSKGKVVFNEAYGFADVEGRVKMTPRHIFRIASHSKTFTATALMQLQEQGTLRIDDYIADYLPWLGDHKDTRWKKVTIRQLMSHGAGVIRDGMDADYWQLEHPFPDAEELKQAIMDADLVIETNTKLKYSNFGYSLLGLLIEAVSGQAYNDYVTEHIVNVLNLPNTGPEYTDDLKGRIVTGYSRRGADKKRLPIAHIDTKSMSAATGFYSAADDMCRYFTAHMVGSGTLLDDESKKEMQRVQFHAKTPGQEYDEDYGLGLEIEYLGDRKTVGHGGGFPGHITQTLFDAKDELVVCVLTNCLDSPASAIVRGIYSIFDFFQEHETSETPEHDTRKFEGVYENLWSTNQIVSAGKQLISINPDNWSPMAHPEKLEYVDESTLKVVDTGSFYSEGELLKFTFDDTQAVTRVAYNGMTMLPQELWREKQQQRSVVAVALPQDDKQKEE